MEHEYHLKKGFETLSVDKYKTKPFFVSKKRLGLFANIQREPITRRLLSHYPFPDGVFMNGGNSWNEAPAPLTIRIVPD